MKPRPTIFISGVSHEFGSFRDVVENEIEMKGCFAENQPGFHPDYSTVEEMLRRKLHDSDAVIHIVGFRFGAEPNQRPTNAPRRSYTQMEFDIARELQKPVYVFLSADAAVRQPPEPDEQPEDDDAEALQRAHRDAVQKTNHLYYFFKDQAELCKRVAEIPLVQAVSFKADISRIIKYAPTELIGRESETEMLNDAWLKVRRAESPRARILTFVGLGGEGKTSLVAKWAADLAYQSWPGCDAVFAWSFYSQGTRDQSAASSDLFLAEALSFFGDAAMAGSAQGAFDKGRRLAQLVGERRALLILDGLEPLQYAPTSPTPGEIKDQGIAALLKGLATNGNGLCVVTTRYAIPDLRAYWQTTAPKRDLPRLSTAAGVKLLGAIGVNGAQAELEKLVEDVDGHALTLQIFGQFLVRAFHGDIRRRDRVNLEKADAKIQGGHAFRAMEAYVKWLEDNSEEARREVAALKLLGLFDRPATAVLIDLLRQAPAIPGLTEPLVGLAEDDWEFSLTALRDAKLLTVNLAEGSGELIALDAHPLLREYFARRLSQQQPEAWRAAHQRLYEHLCATTPDKPDATLEDLQPLYQAVAHGCHAGLQQEVYDTVCEPRIWRRKEVYTVRKLGAFGSDLGAITCFFEQPWSRLSPLLKEADQASILNRSAFCLRALGRLTEAIEPVRTSREIAVKLKKWKDVASSYGDLSELELLLGEVAGAVQDAEQSVIHSVRSGDAEERIFDLTVLANALHQASRRKEAEARFQEAEQMQAEYQPTYPLLYSVQGFQYCDLLLTEAERAAWQRFVVLSSGGQDRPSIPEPCKCMTTNEALAAKCRALSERAAQTLKWEEGMQGAPLLDFALHHLTLSRAALYEALLGHSDIQNSQSEIDAAESGLRHAGQQQYLPLALLTRACLRSLTGERTGPESAQSDLDEAWEIAERGSMKLYMADIHLYRARLFFRDPSYPWRSPQDDLAAAEKLINDCGYHRRDEELADAKRVILGQS
jgi:Domain of unknown function (DUF4062)